MKRRYRLVFALALLVVGNGFQLTAQDTKGKAAKTVNPFVGTWKLVSITNMTDKGEDKEAAGRNPTGFITYTADGRMMVIITNGGRKPLSVPDWIAAPVEERAEAFSTMSAYAGRYTLANDEVVHHVEVSWMQNDVNVNLVRTVKLQGARLTLETPSFVKGGVHITKQVLIWERLRSDHR